MEIRTRRRDDKPTRCPICHDDVDGAVLECSTCRALYHEECGSAHGRCANRCDGNLVNPVAPGATAAVEPRTDASVGPGVAPREDSSFAPLGVCAVVAVPFMYLWWKALPELMVLQVVFLAFMGGLIALVAHVQERLARRAAAIDALLNPPAQDAVPGEPERAAGSEDAGPP